jgi:hypothetical protein
MVSTAHLQAGHDTAPPPTRQGSGRSDDRAAGDPLVSAEAWRYAALAVPAVLLTLLGIIAVGRRDIRSA